MKNHKGVVGERYRLNNLTPDSAIVGETKSKSVKRPATISAPLGLASILIPTAKPLLRSFHVKPRARACEPPKINGIGCNVPDCLWPMLLSAANSRQAIEGKLPDCPR